VIGNLQIDGGSQLFQAGETVGSDVLPGNIRAEDFDLEGNARLTS